jgi:hypothetical protein
MTADSKDKQPQVITSADGKLQIIHNRSYVDRFGCYCVEGAVRNISRDSTLNAGIKIDYFDVNMKQIDTEIDATVRNLKPGVTVAFHTMYSGKRRGEIQYYHIHLANAAALSIS